MIFYIIILLSILISVLSYYFINTIWLTIPIFILSFVVLMLTYVFFSLSIAILYRNKYDSKFARKILISSIHVALAFYGVRYKVDYQVELPKKDNFTVISNHQSVVDILVYLSLFKNYRLSGVAKKELSNVFFLSTWFRQMRYLLIDRDDNIQGAKTIIQAARQVNENQPMMIFPEGTRTPNKDGEMLPFKPGAFNLATRSKSDIYILVMHNLVGRKSIVIPKKIYVTMLPPLTYEEYKDMNTIEISKLCQERIETCLKERKNGKTSKSNSR